MNRLTQEYLQSLLAVGVGLGEQRTPLLNGAGEQLADCADSQRQLQALMAAAPQASVADLPNAWRDYWADLAPGTRYSRRAHARQLRRRNLAAKAGLLGLFGALSAPAQEATLAMLKENWSSQYPLYALALRASDDSRVHIADAVAIDTGVSCVLVFPGLEQELFEFEDRAQAGQALVEYLWSGPGLALQQRLRALGPEPWGTAQFERYGLTVVFGPLDAALLDHGLDQALAEGRLEVERRWVDWEAQRPGWFSRPLPDALTAAVAAALSADSTRQQALLTFAGMGPEIASEWRQQQLSKAEDAILQYIGDALDSYAHKHFRQKHAALNAVQARVDALFETLVDEHLPADFWLAKDDNGLTFARRWVAETAQALGHEAQLQVYENTLSAAALEVIQGALSQPTAHQRQGSVTRVLDVSVGGPDFAWPLPAAFVLTTTAAIADAQAPAPVVLFMTGEQGGVREFSTRQAFEQCLGASLRDPSFMPIWARFDPAAHRALRPLVNQDPTPLILRDIEEDWLQRCVVDEVERASSTVAEHGPGLRRRLRYALAFPRNEIRDACIDRIAEQRRVQQVLEGLPGWLQAPGAGVRASYGRKLELFNQAALVQEQWLEESLPPLQRFAGGLLRARIKADLGVDVDPQQVIVRLPVAVEVRAVQNVPTEIHTPSKHKENLTAVELALLNIDRQVTLRLKFARMLDQAHGQPLSIPGLTLAYLRSVIIELDAAQQYRQRISQVFAVNTDASSAMTMATQALLAPYALGFELEAFCERHAGNLDANAYSLLTRVAQARNAAALKSAESDLAIQAVRLDLGGDDQDLPSSLLLIEDQPAGEYLLYLPKVPTGPKFIHARSRADLKEALLARLNDASTASWLAGQGGIRDTTAAREAYLRQASIRQFTGFIHFAPQVELAWPLPAALLAMHKERLLEGARSASRSRADVREAFAQQLREGAAQILRSGLDYLPGIGTALQLYDGWNDGVAAVTAFGQGNNALGLRRLASAELNFGFALLSFIPGAGAARQVRGAVRARQALRPATPVHVGLKRPPKGDFRGYESDISLVGAQPQFGADLGTWKQQGKLYLWQNDTAYEVFRRSGEQSLRLRPTASKGYAQPVRRSVDGRFVAHADVGGKGGGRGRGLEQAVDPQAATFKYEVAVEHREVMRGVLASGNPKALDLRYAPMSPEGRSGWSEALAFAAKRDLLLSDADAYLAQHTLPARAELPNLAGHASQQALIEAVYAKSNGLVVGESHASLGAKRLLVDNMATLKAQGVKTLYFEHLLTDFDGIDLQALNSGAGMPARLLNSLGRLDTGHRVTPGQPYTFLAVVGAASRAGIEVVAIDCAASYHLKGMNYTGRAHRERIFSYYATQIITAHQAKRGEHKWVALVGNAHTNTLEHVPGLAELNQGIGLRVSSVAPGQGAIGVDAGEEFFALGSGTVKVKADLHVQVEVPPTPSSSAVAGASAALPLAGPSLARAGMFYFDKREGKRVIVHLSRDGRTYRTPVSKTLGFYSLSRPSWDKVHERRFLTLNGLLEALKDQGLTYVAR